MCKEHEYIGLEISDDNLNKLVAELRQKLLREFWPDIPEGEYKERIRSRLEKSILCALEFKSDSC